MPRNGSGSYSLPQSPFVPGTTISSTAVNSDLSDIASALTGSVAADGQTPMTGTLQMNTNAVSGVTTITGVTGTFSGLVTATNIGRGCLVSKNLDQAISQGADTILTWGSEQYDDAAIFDIGQPTRLTVPAGFSRVRLSFGITWEGASVDQRTDLLKNGAAVIGAAFAYTAAGTVTSPTTAYTATSAMLAVTAGDYFEVQVHLVGTGPRDVDGGNLTWFAMELMR